MADNVDPSQTLTTTEDLGPVVSVSEAKDETLASAKAEALLDKHELVEEEGEEEKETRGDEAETAENGVLPEEEQNGATPGRDESGIDDAKAEEAEDNGDATHEQEVEARKEEAEGEETEERDEEETNLPMSTNTAEEENEKPQADADPSEPDNDHPKSQPTLEANGNLDQSAEETTAASGTTEPAVEKSDEIILSHNTINEEHESVEDGMHAPEGVKGEPAEVERTEHEEKGEDDKIEEESAEEAQLRESVDQGADDVKEPEESIVAAVGKAIVQPLGILDTAGEVEQEPSSQVDKEETAEEAIAVNEEEVKHEKSDDIQEEPQAEEGKPEVAEPEKAEEVLPDAEETVHSDEAGENQVALEVAEVVPGDEVEVDSGNVDADTESAIPEKQTEEGNGSIIGRVETPEPQQVEESIEPEPAQTETQESEHVLNAQEEHEVATELQTERSDVGEDKREDETVAESKDEVQVQAEEPAEAVETEEDAQETETAQPHIESEELAEGTAAEPAETVVHLEKAEGETDEGVPAADNSELPTTEERPAPEPELVKAPSIEVFGEDGEHQEIEASAEELGAEESKDGEVTEPKPETAVEEVQTRPWTPSYSVSRQGSISSLKADVADEGEDEEVKADEKPQEGEASDNLPSSEVKIPSFNITTDGLESHGEGKAEEAERPKSPWTPSYSVSRQGSPAPSIKETEVPEVEKETVTATADSVFAEDESSGVKVEEPTPQAEEPVLGETENEGKILPEDEPTKETILAENDKAIDGALEPEVAAALENLEVQQNKEIVEVPFEETIATFVPPSLEVTPEHDSQEAEAAVPRGLERKQSWTQSYSVSNLNSPNLGVNDLPADTEEQPEDSEPLAEVVREEIEKDTTEPPRLERKPSWTQSYSVSNQFSGGPETEEPSTEAQENGERSHSLAVQAIPESNVESKETQPNLTRSGSWSQSYSVSNQGSPNLSVKDLPGDKPESPRPPSLKFTSEESAEDASPPAPQRQQSWTQSYSVSNQGSPSPSLKELHADQAERPQTPTIQVSSVEGATETVEPPQLERKPSWTQSYSKSDQGSPRLGEKGLPAEHRKEAEVVVLHNEPRSDVVPQAAEVKVSDSEEVPQKQWTPSYSVMFQGSPHASAKDLPSESEQQLDTDAPSQESAAEETPDKVEEAPRLWTPSYSVSNQGSPRPESRDLPAQEEPENASSTAPDAEASSNEAQPEQPAQLWTPSYSVSRQGSPRPSTKELDGSATNVNEEPEPASEEARPNVLWTPSYSVSRQGSPTPSVKGLGVSKPASDTPDRHEPQTKTANGTVHAADSKPGMQRSSTYGVEEDDPATIFQIPRLDIETENPEIVLANLPPAAKTQTEVEDRPKSPWTPSYSVTNQGSADEEVLKLDGVAPEEENDPATFSEFKVQNAATEIAQGNGHHAPQPEQLHEVVNIPSRPYTPSYSVTRQGSVSSEVVGRSIPKPDNEELIMPKIDIEEPHSRSYDARSNGTSTPTQYDAHTATPGKASRSPSNSRVQVFPTLETLHDDLMRAAANVNDDGDDFDRRPSLPPLTTTRDRLDSTTSSKFFPGGWISSPPQTPQQGRASLEVVTGEFTPAKMHGDSQLLSPYVGPAAPPATPVNGVDEEERKKWCVVM